MDAVFFFLLWISSPSGGHSEIFGAQADCEVERKVRVEAHDTLYLSDCVRVEMKFVKSVRQEYQRPSEVFAQ